MVIGRGRRREHPKDTSKGSSELRSLRVLRNLRLCMRTPKGTPKGWSDLWSHPVAMVLLLRKKRGKKPWMCRTYFRSAPLPDRVSSSHVTDVTSGHKALLGRIWYNFRLHMSRTYFRTMTNVTSGHVTFGHVTSGHALWSDPPHDPPQIRLELPPYTTMAYRWSGKKTQITLVILNSIFYSCKFSYLEIEPDETDGIFKFIKF
jgi:hypothetical protein